MFSKGWCLLVPIGWDGSVYILCLHLFDGSHVNMYIDISYVHAMNPTARKQS